ncbi:D-galactarate dehydratase [Pseudoroseicyclus aestuarii]|uniref:D-galactarate dehydratase/altronate hydrolase n=1 Tax=Pseudoroseicyclus aestuarii TaxID=1795041 RepID=A0A318SUU9_9RHOB|nr:D-galactarate dehydratase [Pseudoroseicyclus aestuarii]PYE85393.1 hypothetical protein DFP88_10158 [Pseudoroseicyclus aestuarii]
MKHIASALAVTLALGACAQVEQASAPAPAAPAPASDAAPAASAPAITAGTAEQFDTTSAEDRAAATQAPAEGAQRLGTTVASLGAPTEPGIWLETPLVSAVTPGRVEAAGGASVNLELRPSGGSAGSGSQISLAALRLLELPLTSLPELTVFSR